MMTRDGFPVAHHVFLGNTADISAFRSALKDLKERFYLRRVVIVADRGVVSEELIEELGKGPEAVDYILGMRLRKNKEVRDIVLSRAGCYHRVAGNLGVKGVWVGGRRYIVCYNEEEGERDRQRRQEIIEWARKDLEKKWPQAFVMPQGLKQFVALRGGELVLKEDVTREEACYDGKWVLRMSIELPADEIAQAYQGLWQIGHTFRELKSGLEIRPAYLLTEDHVRGHILICFLALVLEATLQRLLKDQGIRVGYREVMADLEQLVAVRFEARGKAWLWRTELQELAYRLAIRPFHFALCCCGTSFSSATAQLQLASNSSLTLFQAKSPTQMLAFLFDISLLPFPGVL